MPNLVNETKGGSSVEDEQLAGCLNTFSPTPRRAENGFVDGPLLGVTVRYNTNFQQWLCTIHTKKVLAESILALTYQ